MASGQAHNLILPHVGTTTTERIPRLDLAVGVERRVCERAVRLLDKLRRSEIMPFATESRTTSVAASTVTSLEISDLKNPFNAPWVMTQVRVFTSTGLAASASGATSSNLTLRLIDNDRQKPLFKRSIRASALVGLDSNTWELDRPHVLGPAASLYAQIESTGAPGNGIWAAFLGEVVLGGIISAAEVREAIGLGIYPTSGWRAGAWTQSALLPLLMGDQPVCETEEGERLRWSLRERIAELRLKLAAATIQPYILANTATSDVPQAGSIVFPIAFLRNDSAFPVVMNKVVLATVASAAASAIGSVFNNISILAQLTGGNDDRYITWKRALAPTFVDRSTNTWMFERPCLLKPDEAIRLVALEENVNATTDLYAAFHGFVIQGLSNDEVRECISLGLFSAWRRSGD